MSKKDSLNKVGVEITPDFILCIYKQAKELTGEDKKAMIKVAEVLSDHIGEYLTSK